MLADALYKPLSLHRREGTNEREQGWFVVLFLFSIFCVLVFCLLVCFLLLLFCLFCRGFFVLFRFILCLCWGASLKGQNVK